MPHLRCAILRRGCSARRSLPRRRAAAGRTERTAIRLKRLSAAAAIDYPLKERRAAGRLGFFRFYGSLCRRFDRSFDCRCSRCRRSTGGSICRGISACAHVGVQLLFRRQKRKYVLRQCGAVIRTYGNALGDHGSAARAARDFFSAEHAKPHIYSVFFLAKRANHRFPLLRSSACKPRHRFFGGKAFSVLYHTGHSICKGISTRFFRNGVWLCVLPAARFLLKLSPAAL